MELWSETTVTIAANSTQIVLPGDSDRVAFILNPTAGSAPNCYLTTNPNKPPPGTTTSIGSFTNWPWIAMTVDQYGILVQQEWWIKCTNFSPVVLQLIVRRIVTVPSRNRVKQLVIDPFTYDAAELPDAGGDDRAEDVLKRLANITRKVRGSRVV